jgi:glycosyltransferase involved in cell wall biosynthesis
MMELSIVVVSYNMKRELPRTLCTLSASMQRGIAADDYEVIVVDNGSTLPFCEAECRRWLPKLIVHHMENPTPSPVPAVNKGLQIARGRLIGVFIDGARMATPGMLATALLASRLHERPVIGTLAFHLGSEVQMESVRKGYNKAVEDALLGSIGWEEDGYRLFGASVFAGSSAKGWFVLPAETNALFLTAPHWRELDGYDAAFVTPGGGLANLDIWARVCADERSCVIMLVGEATFHQVHGGIATNSLEPPLDLFQKEYRLIRGQPFIVPHRQPKFLGATPRPAMHWIDASAAVAQQKSTT